MFTSIQGFVSKEPRVERLENKFARLFGRHLSLLAMRLAAVFVETAYFYKKMINHLLQIRVLQIHVLQILLLQICVLQIRVLQIQSSPCFTICLSRQLKPSCEVV